MKTFSILEALEFGWQKTREHSGLLFQVMLTFFALQVVQQIVAKTIGHTLLGVLAVLALGVLSIVLSAGFTVVLLRLVDGTPAHYHDLFPWNRMVLRYFLSSLFAAIITIVGFCLLIVPGIYFMLRFSMARFIVTEGARPLESLRTSTAVVQGHKWHLLGFLLVLLGINIVGAILLLVGLLVSVPVSMLAWTHVYRKLQ
jgi:uncharacterized membrane protein